MRRASSLIVLGLALAACRGKPRGPATPTCAEAGARVAAGMREVKPVLVEAKLDPTAELVAMCKADRWSPAVVACFGQARAAAEHRRCAAQLDPGQREHARVVQDDLYARAAATVGEAPGPRRSTGIPACDDYVQVLERLATCDQMPKEALASMKEALAAMRSAWAGIDPKDTQTVAAAASGCRAAADALHQSARSLGC